MAEGVLKVQAKGRKGARYRILRYKNEGGAWKQKSLGSAQAEDAELIGEGVEVTFEWREGNQVELVDWPPSFGKQVDEEVEAAADPPVGDSVRPERPVLHPVKPVDEVQALTDGIETGFAILRVKLEDIIRSEAFPTSAHPYWHTFVGRLEDFEAEVKGWFEEDGKRFKEMEDRWWGPAA